MPSFSEGAARDGGNHTNGVFHELETYTNTHKTSVDLHLGVVEVFFWNIGRVRVELF